MSDHETSFNLENLQERGSVTENRIPRSPAVDTYESYAAWRKKKFPPKPLNYREEDCTLSNPQSNNDNYLNKNSPNSDFQKSSYFPTESQHSPSEKSSIHNHPNLMLPRSSYFSPDPENFTSAAKTDTKRCLPSSENNYQKYNPNAFQSRDKESEHFQSPHRMKTSSPVNKISREAQHYLKMYSARSDNPPLNSSPRFSKTPSNSNSPNSQHSNSEYTGNLRSDQRDFIPNSKLRKTSVDTDHRSNPNARALQPVRYKSDHRHSFPNCCPMEHKREPENGEIIKGLLKIIDNQTEQIKNLQAQLDRLLNIHEKTLKEKTKCICSHEIPRQNPQICMQAYNAALQSQTSSTETESYNQGYPKIQDSNQDCNEVSNRRNVQFEDHSKKTLMERKVSIGVMTSFEFTVQNSPFNLENDDQPVIQDQDDDEIYREGEKNPSNLEQSRRKQNLFSLMPSPLENIIEDSESHLSSSQQPSSNCLSSCKSGNLQTQSGRYKSTSGNSSNANNTNNTNNRCNFNNSNSPCNYNTSNKNMRSNQNYSTNQNTPNVQNRRESGQDIETRNHGDVGLDLSKQNSSLVTRNQPVNRESISNSRRSGTPRRSEGTGAVNRSPDFYGQEENRRERQDQRIDRRENNRIEDNFQDESLNLSGGQLEVRERIPPSPEPSIHVDMQEYSSEEGSVHTKKTPKVGWTFYNNVLGQVNNILQNSPMEEEDGRNSKNPERREWDNNVLIDTVKATTMDQLKKLGISFVDNNEAKEANQKVTFDPSYYARFNPEMNMMQGTNYMNETNTSMHMKALAMKYLKEEQVCDAMQQKQRRGALKNLMLSNVQGTTNMSFATMRYLQRYQLLPESMNGYIEDEGKENFQMPQISENQEPMMQKPRPQPQSRPVLPQTTNTRCPSKILDISTLKQQPKLL